MKWRQREEDKSSQPSGDVPSAAECAEVVSRLAAIKSDIALVSEQLGLAEQVQPMPVGYCLVI